MKQTTLCFLLQEDKILLAMKKRGFGVGHWNGVGGKQMPGETLEEATIREAKEEIGVTPQNLKKVAEITFTFPEVPAEQGWDQVCHIYSTTEWEGEPEESEEMAPKWFSFNEIPYSEMWPDDIFWVPRMLEGKRFKASFSFSPNQEILHQEIEEIIAW